MNTPRYIAIYPYSMARIHRLNVNVWNYSCHLGLMHVEFKKLEYLCNSERSNWFEEHCNELVKLMMLLNHLLSLSFLFWHPSNYIVDEKVLNSRSSEATPSFARSLFGREKFRCTNSTSSIQFEAYFSLGDSKLYNRITYKCGVQFEPVYKF